MPEVAVQLEEPPWRKGGAGAGREGWAPLSRALSPLHSSEGGGDRDFPGPRYDRGPPLYLKESNTSLSLIYFLQLLHPVSISHCQCLVGHPVHSANSQFLVLTIMNDKVSGIWRRLVAEHYFFGILQFS